MHRRLVKRQPERFAPTLVYLYRLCSRDLRVICFLMNDCGVGLRGVENMLSFHLLLRGFGPGKCGSSFGSLSPHLSDGASLALSAFMFAVSGAKQECVALFLLRCFPSILVCLVFSLPLPHRASRCVLQ